MLPQFVRSTWRGLGAVLLIGTTVAGAALSALPAKAGDLVVRYDQSTLLKLPRPVAEVIIGNPSIADVAIQGGNMMVVTGKSFGVTNIIALDSAKEIIQDQRLIVIRDEARVLNLHKGASRTSYNCTPNCNLTLTIGDDFSHFDNLGRSTDKKLKMGEGSSDGSQAAQ